MNRSPDSVGVRDKAAAALSTVTRWMRRCLPRPGSSLRLAFDLAFGVVAPPVLLHLDLAWDPADLGGRHRPTRCRYTSSRRGAPKRSRRSCGAPSATTRPPRMKATSSQSASASSR